MIRCLATLALSAVILSVAPCALMAGDAEALCPLGNATLRGTYMVMGAGYVVGVGPATAVGTTTFDGKGNGVNSFTASINGAIHQGTVTTLYTVNPDCTGSVSQSDGSHYERVVAPDGSRFDWIETDAGTVLSGSAIRLDPRP